VSGQKVIIYGGSGFLGSHVADALTAQGYRVTVFDHQESPHLHDDQKMIVGDLMDMDQVIRAAEGCRYVYNFAAIADINEALGKPVETARINVLGNVHTLEAARFIKAKRFVFASSVYVYSRSGSFYRASKQASEQFVETYYQMYGLPYSIVRYGTLYGRRADDRNGVFRILKSALTTGEVTYTGDPQEQREYIHVADAARLSVDILADKFENRHLVLTGTERLLVKNLIRMVSEICPQDVKIKYEEAPPTSGHYILTPYSYNPKMAHKLVATDHVDIGQGLLDCIEEMHDRGIGMESANGKDDA
jgi:UDP-glucose 4-epimerase